ncbi:MAG: PTS sugar transporter subunit IIB [Firmicutes bacterium]|nr:PTS sugar transporter subunit IIB [Bacillota bacterium]
MDDKGNLKILVVCTFGAGSSLMLRLNIEGVLKEAKIPGVTVEVADTGTFKGKETDIIAVSASLEKAVQGHPTAKKVVPIKSFFDKKELRDKFGAAIDELRAAR